VLWSKFKPSLEERSDANLVYQYEKALLRLHRTGNKSNALTLSVINRLRARDLIVPGGQIGHGRTYCLTEKTHRILNESNGSKVQRTMRE